MFEDLTFFVTDYILHFMSFYAINQVNIEQRKLLPYVILIDQKSRQIVRYYPRLETKYNVQFAP